MSGIDVEIPRGSNDTYNNVRISTFGEAYVSVENLP